jgi:hypothetical protein
MVADHGAVVLFTLNGTESFALGRNVTAFLDDDYHDTNSNETSADDYHLDSLELNDNQTSLEDVHPHDSLEFNSRLVKRDLEFALLDQSTSNGSLVLLLTDDGLSLEDVAFVEQEDQANPTIRVDHLPQDDLHHLRIDSLENVDDFDKRHVPAGDAGLLIVQGADGSEHAFLTDGHHFDDYSLEVVSNHDEQVSLLSALDQQPLTGVFTHPLSDDLYLVKEYLDDYYLWEMEDELARAYLSQSVNLNDPIVFHFTDDRRPKKLSAVHFAQFTPVQSVLNDRIHATSPAL